MTYPRLRAPYKYPVAYERSATDRKQRIRRFGICLRVILWLTTERDAFLNVPSWGFALCPVHPHVIWRWKLRNGDIFISRPLVFIGFTAGIWPPTVAGPWLL